MNHKKDSPSEESQGQLVRKDQESIESDKEMADLVSEAPPAIQKLLKEAPPNVRKEFMGMVMQTTRGSLPHPLFDKFTSEHVGRFLELNEQDSNRSFIFASKGRWFQFAYVLVALSFIVFLIIYLLPNNKDILNDLIKVLVGLAGGFGLGYGYKSMK